MTTETNAERLEIIKTESENEFVLMQKYKSIKETDFNWLIQQAERVQELEDKYKDLAQKFSETFNAHLLQELERKDEKTARLYEAHELKDIEHSGLVQQLKEFRNENARLREAIKKSLEVHKWNNEESAQILEKALKGESE